MSKDLIEGLDTYHQSFTRPPLRHLDSRASSRWVNSRSLATTKRDHEHLGLTPTRVHHFIVVSMTMCLTRSILAVHSLDRVLHRGGTGGEVSPDRVTSPRMLRTNPNRHCLVEKLSQRDTILRSGVEVSNVVEFVGKFGTREQSVRIRPRSRNIRSSAQSRIRAFTRLQPSEWCKGGEESDDADRECCHPLARTLRLARNCRCGS